METTCIVCLIKLYAAMQNASDFDVAMILHGGHLHGSPSQVIQLSIQHFRIEPVRTILALTALERAELPSRLRDWYQRHKIETETDVMT